MNSSSETTVQWQPVQVGGNLPTPEVRFSSYRYAEYIVVNFYPLSVIVMK